MITVTRQFGTNYTQNWTNMQLMQLAEVYKTDYHSCFCVAEHLAATVQDFQELIDAEHL